eukprot:14474947-Alexandrium_andersonii.AAC.1
MTTPGKGGRDCVGRRRRQPDSAEVLAGRARFSGPPKWGDAHAKAASAREVKSGPTPLLRQPSRMRGRRLPQRVASQRGSTLAWSSRSSTSRESR